MTASSGGLHTNLRIRLIAGLVVVSAVSVGAAGALTSAQPSSASGTTVPGDAAPPSSDPMSDEVAPVHVVDPSADAEIIDAYAEQYGIDRAEAIVRLNAMSMTTPLSQQLGRVLSHDQYGGVWFDNSDGRIKIGIISEATRPVIEGVLETVGASDVADIVQVEFSYAELMRSSTALAEIIRSHEPQRAVSSGLDTSTNQIVLSFETGLTVGQLDESESAILEAAQSEFGDMLRVDFSAQFEILEACTSPNCDPPLRGGVGIYSSAGQCTAAFNGLQSSSSTPYVVTAAHCTSGA